MVNQGSILKRSPYMDQEYFDTWVDYDEKAIQKFESTISDPSTSETQRRRLRYTISRRRLELLLSRYSRGEGIDILCRSFPRIVSSMEEYHSEERHEPIDFRALTNYVSSLWLVSLAILCDADAETMQRLLRVIDNEGRDELFERLVALRVPGRSVPNGLMHPNPYRPLLDAVNSTGDNREKNIREFLKIYYKGMKGTYWYDSHKKLDAGFFGYWCLELAALVKGLGIDDRSFSDNPFYPRDFAGK